MSPRLLFAVADDWLFVQFRLPLAQELLRRGYHLSVACRITGCEAPIRDAGIDLYPVPFARGSVSPLAISRACLAARQVIRQARPSLLQAVALWPIMVGWLGALAAPRPPWINLITGLGSLFTQGRPGLRLRSARMTLELLSRMALSHPSAHNVFQNQDDLAYFTRRRLAPAHRSRVIPGSGVDTEAWSPRPEPAPPPYVLVFVGRILRDKGVSDLVQASALLSRRGLQHILRLVGDVDPDNPSSLHPDQIHAWQQAGAVEWLGQRDDVLAQMSSAHAVVLPSYREGLPKTLLEAGVAERPVVTCDVPGCRDLVTNGINGLLVPPRDPPALASAIERLLREPDLRRRLALAHSAIVRERYSNHVIIPQFLALYAEILGTAGGASCLRDHEHPSRSPLTQGEHRPKS